VCLPGVYLHADSVPGVPAESPTACFTSSLPSPSRALARPRSKANEQLAIKSFECETQTRQTQALRERLDNEASLHRAARLRNEVLEAKLQEVIGAASEVATATARATAAASARAVAQSADAEAGRLVGAADALLRTTPQLGSGQQSLHAGGTGDGGQGSSGSGGPIRGRSEQTGASSLLPKADPKASSPWRDPFGEDYILTPSSSGGGGGGAGSGPGRGASREDDTWWPAFFNRNNQQEVGKRLVLRV